MPGFLTSSWRHCPLLACRAAQPTVVNPRVLVSGQPTVTMPRLTWWRAARCRRHRRQRAVRDGAVRHLRDAR